MQARRRALVKELQAQSADIIAKAKLREFELRPLVLYTGPMYLVYNARLRGFPKHISEMLEGNRYETTIFCIISGLIKLSKVSPIPANRRLYRGLGGMKLPESFWKQRKGEFQGGVELGLLSTTANRDIALQYSGAGDGKLATIFEVEIGSVDVGGLLGFLSQYPGEEEYLVGPYACLEVMGRPRVEVTDKGQVTSGPQAASRASHTPAWR